MADVAYTDGQRFSRPVTSDDIDAWRVSQEELLSVCSANTLPIQNWDRIGSCGIAYGYRSFDRHWTGLLLGPSKSIDGLGLKGAPLIMIPSAENVVITGDEDWWGIRATIRRCISLTANPITIHPLVFNGEKWVPYENSVHSLRRMLARFTRLERRGLGH